MLSLAQPHHYYQNFLSQGVGMGIGMGLMFLPSLTVTSHYFRARRSLAMGMVIVGAFQLVDRQFDWFNEMVVRLKPGRMFIPCLA